MPVFLKKGRPEGIEPSLAEPQSAVLPLNYGRHVFNKCPREESNLCLGIRNPSFYPLNYRGIIFFSKP